VAAHQRAPGPFVEGIETEHVPGALDSLAERAVLFEQIDETRKNCRRPSPQPFPIGVDPLARAVWKEVALVESRRFLQSGVVPGKAPPGRGLERYQIHERVRFSSPGEGPGAWIEEFRQLGRAVAEVVQFATEIRQCLRIGRIWPERARDSLPGNAGVARMEHQECDQFLLARARLSGRDTAAGENPEPSE
jgi:hypothetical protein